MLDFPRSSRMDNRAPEAAAAGETFDEVVFQFAPAPALPPDRLFQTQRPGRNHAGDGRRGAVLRTFFRLAKSVHVFRRRSLAIMGAPGLVRAAVDCDRRVGAGGMGLGSPARRGDHGPVRRRRILDGAAGPLVARSLERQCRTERALSAEKTGGRAPPGGGGGRPARVWM